jgi:O-antigen ligase
MREFAWWCFAPFAAWWLGSWFKPQHAESPLTFAWAGIAGAALYAALELLLVVSGLVFDRTLDYWQVFAGYVNPRFFNHVQTLLIPLLLGLLGWSAVRGLWRGLAAFALVANAFFLLLLMGRATLLALIVGLLLALLCFGQAGRDYARRFVLAFAAGGVLYLLIIELLPRLLSMEPVPAFRELGERGSIEARFYLWRIALDMIAAHPWLGVGPMHYANQFNGEAAHPHNIYLQIAAEYGLPFFLILTFVLLRWFWRMTQRLRQHLSQTPDALALGCWAGLVGALVDGAFSGNFVMPLSQLWILITVILLLQRLPQGPPADPGTTRPSRLRLAVWRVGLTLLLLAQLYVLVDAWQEFRQTPVRIQGAQEPVGATHYSPRFWRDGWF